MDALRIRVIRVTSFAMALTLVAVANRSPAVESYCEKRSRRLAEPPIAGSIVIERIERELHRIARRRQVDRALDESADVGLEEELLNLRAELQRHQPIVVSHGDCGRWFGMLSGGGPRNRRRLGVSRS